MQNTIRLKDTTTVRDVIKSDKRSAHGSRSHRTENIKTIVDESIKAVTPAWPLQQSVAVNPFWFQRHQTLNKTFNDLESTLHQSLFMPLSYYLDKYNNEEIEKHALKKALIRAKERWNDTPETIEGLESLSTDKLTTLPKVKSFSEFLNDPIISDQRIIEDIGKFCAAYFDDKQAVIRYPWQSGSFWQGWFEAQRFDKTLTILGIKNFNNIVDSFRGASPLETIQSILEEISFDNQLCQVHYMQRLLFTVNGWASQFKYLEWQKMMGRHIDRTSGLIELLAVRMIYDYGLLHHIRERKASVSELWISQLNEASAATSDTSLSHKISYIWHWALELTYQNCLAQKLQEPSRSIGSTPKFQIAFCIDVRSEMIRRHIETTNRDIQTIGFAGFFGMPIAYKKIDESQKAPRLPVLLNPQLDVFETGTSKQEETSLSDHWKKTGRTPTMKLIYSYFRILRKANLSSLLYVELFGILAVINLILRTSKAIVAQLKGDKVPASFDCCHTHPDTSKILLEEKITRARDILTHMGLRKDFAKLIILSGHGAATTNNALSSALDCGACGGHAGDINARVVVSILNEERVRSGLRSYGIEIPKTTWFVAAVHETVTDSIYILDRKLIPQQFSEDIDELESSLKSATQATRQERQSARSSVLDHNAIRRSSNWAETRPEWGLCGNASFIVAPRARTVGVNLSSRTFLHDYDWRQDQEFKTLELIMTAPMIVTNWINLQYYGSVVAPNYFGSGNKVLHNVTGENAVVEGNGGDLKIGLSIQSVHDGKNFVHEPLRLSVFIEAPRAAIEDIIDEHQLVKDLVDNEWLHILQIDPESQKIFRRLTTIQYEVAAFIDEQ